MKALLLTACLCLTTCGTDNIPADQQDTISSSLRGAIRRIQLPDGWLVTYKYREAVAVTYVPGNLNWELKR